MRKDYLILIMLVIFYLLGNLAWYRAGANIPANMEESFQIRKMIDDYYNIPGTGEFFRRVGSSAYGPAYYMFPLLFKKVFGESLTVLRFQNIFWFLFLLFYLYKLAFLLFDRKVAIISMLLLSFYPVVYGASRLFLAEFAILSIAPAVFYYLIRSKSFTDLKNTCLFVLFLSLGIMLRFAFSAFIFVPLIYTFTMSSGHDKEERKRKLLYSLVGVLICAVILYFRFRPLGASIMYFLRLPFGEYVEPWYTYNSIKLFTLGLFNYQLSLPLGLLFLASLPVFMSKYRAGYNKKLLLMWIIVPLIIVVFMPHRKALRFIIPYLPPFAMISAYGLSRLGGSIKARLLYMLFAALSVYQYFNFSFALGFPMDEIKISSKNGYIRYIYLDYTDENALCFPPFKGDYYKEVLSTIRNNSFSNDQKIIIGPLWEDTVENWRMYFRFNKSLWHAVMIKNDLKFLANMLAALDDADWFLLSSGKKLEDFKDTDAYLADYLDSQTDQTSKNWQNYMAVRSIDKLYFFEDYAEQRREFRRKMNDFYLVRAFPYGQDVHYLFARKFHEK